MTLSPSSPDNPSLPKPESTSSSAEGKAHRPPVRLVIPLLLLLVGVGYGVWYVRSRPNPNEIVLSGRIEGYPTDLDAKVSGRVESVAVREGDRVRQGQVLVTLDDAELQAQVDGSKARVQSARERVQQAQLQLGVIQSQIQEAQISVQQASEDSSGRIYQAESTLATAEAQLAQAEAQVSQAKSQLTLAQRDRDRFAELFQAGAISEQQFDQAQTAFESAQETLKTREALVLAAERQVNAAQGSLTQSQSTSLNPEIRTAQINTLEQQLAVAQAQLQAAQAEVMNAESAQREVEARLSNLTITSPIDGVVITRSVEPGTVVSPGITLLTVLNPDQVYLRGFIPEGQVGRLRVGQAARVYLDSDPDHPLTAKVSAVDTQAAFTPENIYFKDDRVRQVFGVDLQIENADGLAKPGMPADGEIVVPRNN